MIQVTVLQDSNKVVCGVTLDGHAGYSESGQDIVCAAVSALTLNLANSVEAFTDDKFEAAVDDEEGYFHFRLTSLISSESKLLMDSMLLGIENIQSSYGKQYIKIRFKEV